MKCENVCNISKLCPVSLGLAFGILKGLSLMILALAGTYGYGLEMIQHISSMLHGYGPSFVGGLWGGLWGLICGFIFGALLALIYDCCLCCLKKSCSSDNKDFSK